MIKALVFDWGNVLEFFDAEGMWTALAEQYQLDRDRFAYFELSLREKKFDGGLISIDEYFERLNKEFGISIDQKKYVKTYFSHLKPNTELLGIIKKLKPRYKMIILSNNNPFFFERITKLGFDTLFDTILFSCQERLLKPDPRFYQKVFETGLKPDECVFVDDRETFVEGAKQVGMHAVVYRGIEQFSDNLVQFSIRVDV
ncbi:MAG: HAD family phosphatase [Nanoarchaeota archaeon]|nr:HAD family phosphatase [Nanoarchaeota archaeon]